VSAALFLAAVLGAYAPTDPLFQAGLIKHQRHVVEVGLPRLETVLNAKSDDQGVRASFDLTYLLGVESVGGRHSGALVGTRAESSKVFNLALNKVDLAFTDRALSKVGALPQTNVVSGRLAEILEINWKAGLKRKRVSHRWVIKEHNIGPKLERDRLTLRLQRAFSRLGPNLSVISSKLGKNGGSGGGREREGANYRSKPAKPKSVVGGVPRRIGGLPLGAKITGTIITALLAWLVMTIGFVRALKGRRYVVQGGCYILIGCVLWFATGFFWQSGS
jgi:hypothetical protein